MESAEPLELIVAALRYTPSLITNIINCSRCLVILDGYHYHCLECSTPEISLCLPCVRNGLYCSNDNHNWTEALMANGRREHSGDIISPREAKLLLPDTPSVFLTRKATETPTSLFEDEHRFIRLSDPREILIYTQGVCSRRLNDERAFPRAGCSFVYRPTTFNAKAEMTHAGTISFALETLGPMGGLFPMTTRRAQLRAVLAALQFRDWVLDCNRSWRSIVIATTAEYITVNATKYLKRWESQDWMAVDHQTGGPGDVEVKNQDLWRLLLKEIRRLHLEGVGVRFWTVPEECNERAGRFARAATEEPKVLNFEQHVALGKVKFQSIPLLI